MQTSTSATNTELDTDLNLILNIVKYGNRENKDIILDLGLPRAFSLDKAITESLFLTLGLKTLISRIQKIPQYDHDEHAQVIRSTDEAYAQYVITKYRLTKPSKLNSIKNPFDFSELEKQLKENIYFKQTNLSPDEIQGPYINLLYSFQQQD